MITNEIKDRILFDLTGRDEPIFSFSAVKMSQHLDIPYSVIITVIDYFKNINLIKISSSFGDTSGGRISVLVPAYDLARRGGFVVQEEILKANIQKLGLEIDVLEQELSPKGLESAEKIASISSAILSALSFFR